MTIQIHLIPASLRRTLAVHQAMVVAATAKESPPPTPPTLDFRHHSGRGVRLRILSPEQREVAIETAAKLAGPEATVPEYQAKKLRECVHRMIVAVTKDAELADLGGAEWTKVTQEDLEDGKGSKSFAALFTAKDYEALGALYNRFHSVTVEDLDAIEGNAVEVSDAG